MEDFFTIGTFATLAGCVFSTVLIMNTIRHSFKWGPEWFGLIISILVAIIAYNISSEGSLGDITNNESKITNYFIVFMNGCLIYTSAFGVQNTVINSIEKKDDLEYQSPTRNTITFFSKW